MDVMRQLGSSQQTPSRPIPTHSIQGVGQAGHQLGLGELGLTTLEWALLLHGEKYYQYDSCAGHFLDFLGIDPF